LVRFFPSLKNGWGFTAPQNKRTMENQEEKETSIEYFYDKVLDASEFYESEYQAIVDALNEAKKMYAEEIMNAYKDGWIRGAEVFFKPNENI
jgi:membrane-associated HD superfamily phosphohydrolase